MKTILPLKKTFLTLSLFVLATGFGLVSRAQTQLIFSNSVLVSGTTGADGAIYRFPSVTTNTDALVKIKGRSHSAVKLSSIDQTNTGYGNAFQPEIVYNNGFTFSAVTFWIDFQITFVISNTSTPVAISNFNVTAIDVDGDNNNLHEWDEFYTPNPSAYTVENNTLLGVSDLTEIVNGNPTIKGKRFDGPTTLYMSGVDTAATNIMATITYDNVSSFNFRAGATTTSSSFMTTRMYSTWFKNFNYLKPLSTLPVHLIRFQGNLDKNNKVTLNWTVADNETTSHFEIQRSVNGRDFTTLAVMLASEKIGVEDYSYNETINNNDKVMYRLKMFDKGQDIDYSKVLVFQNKTTSGNNIKILGNPVKDKLTFSYTSATIQTTEVKVYELTGRIVMSQKFTSQEGTNVLSLTLASTLKPGMYVVEVSEGSVIQSTKFVKQ